MAYVVTADNPAKYIYHVELTCTGVMVEKMVVNMPVWIPVFYKIIDFTAAIKGFRVTDNRGDPIIWKKNFRHCLNHKHSK